MGQPETSTFALTCPGSHLCPCLCHIVLLAPLVLAEAAAPPVETKIVHHHLSNHAYENSNCTVAFTHLIHFVPDWVEVLLDHITLERDLSNIDLGIGVTLALHHTAHLIVFGNQTLSLQQDDSQQPL